MPSEIKRNEGEVQVEGDKKDKRGIFLEELQQGLVVGAAGILGMKHAKREEKYVCLFNSLPWLMPSC